MNPEMVEKLWQRSGGKCECKKAAHNHPGGKCDKVLVKEMLDKDGEGSWKILQVFVSGGENINAYAIYCTECFQKLPNALKKEGRFSGNLWGTSK
jgi:hypothetical protein